MGASLAKKHHNKQGLYGVFLVGSKRFDGGASKVREKKNIATKNLGGE